jgi:hypothetical protein
LQRQALLFFLIEVEVEAEVEAQVVEAQMVVVKKKIELAKGKLL